MGLDQDSGPSKQISVAFFGFVGSRVTRLEAIASRLVATRVEAIASRRLQGLVGMFWTVREVDSKKRVAEKRLNCFVRCPQSTELALPASGPGIRL